MPINEKAQAQLKAYRDDSERIALAYNESVKMLRAAMNVPEDYLLHDIAVGFEPPEPTKEGQA